MKPPILLPRLFVAATLALWLAAMAAGAQTPVTTQPAPPQGQVFKLLDVAAELDQLSVNVAARLAEQRDKFPAELYAHLQAAAQEAFEGKGLRAEFLRNLERDLSSRDAKECVEFLASPLAKKLTDLEAGLSGPEASARASEFARTLKPDAKGSARKALVQRQIDRSDAVDSYVRRSRYMSIALHQSVSRILPPEQRPSREEFDRQLAELDRQLRPAFRTELTSLLLFAYRSVPDTELQAAIAFYESRAGQALRSSLQRSGTETFESATKLMAESFERRVGTAAKPAVDW
ncbi:MAG: hypothetical protein HY814_08465 [Candidatus Riflebacteria bacterium]|nr:hypothetical protein [Candidatus Riflebacteria bacterium]